MRLLPTFALCLTVAACGGGRNLSLGGELMSGMGGVGGGTNGSGGVEPSGGGSGAISGSGGGGGVGGGATGGGAGSGGTGVVCDLSPDEVGAQELLAQASGFGEATRGGRDGCVVRVTTAEDNVENPPPGSLRAVLQSPDPAWIVFDIDEPIVLLDDISVGPNKTLDGGNAPSIVTVRDFGLLIDGRVSQNVIIHNIAFVGNYTNNDRDGIWISEFATRVWIDHCSFSAYGDEHIEVSHGATFVTISWTHFFEQDPGENSHPLLFGDDTNDPNMEIDTVIRVTSHHNFFDQTNSYHPRLRYGKVHSYNNWFYRWADHGCASSMRGELVSENNFFSGYGSPRAIVNDVGDPEVGFISTLGDVTDNEGDDEDPVIVDSPPPPGSTIFSPSDHYERDDYRFDPADQVPTLVTTQAGPHLPPRF